MGPGGCSETTMLDARGASMAVPQLPGEPDGARGFSIEAGYLPARPAAAGGRPQDEAHLYFMLQRARTPTARRKLIVWLNGGPGCSSFDGAFLELGAFRVRPQGKLASAPRGHAWNEYVDVLYVDQPVGTGFSYVENGAYAQTLEQVAAEFVHFMREFVRTYPEYTQESDLYLAGESYAGQYIPYMADALLRATDVPFGLEGIAIGNGYIDPVSQYGAEVEALVRGGVWAAQGAEHKHAQPLVQACRDAMAKDSMPRVEYPVCDRIAEDIINATTRTYVLFT